MKAVRSGCALGGLILLVAVSGAFAQPPFWTQTNGPTGGCVNSIVVHPNGGFCVGMLYIGILRSSDDGLNWTRVSTGQELPLTVRALAVDAADRIYASGTFYDFDSQDAIVRSSDSGQSWQFLTAMPGFIMQFVFDAAGRIFVTTQSMWDPHIPAGVYRSEDDGGSWYPIRNGMPAETEVTAIAIHPSGHIYAGSRSIIEPPIPGRLYKSSNAGDSWEPIFYNGSDSISVEDVVTTGSGYVFAATYQYGILRSTDDGLSWGPCNDGLPDDIVSRLSVSSEDEVFAETEESGVYRLPSSGVQWIEANNGLQDLRIRSLSAFSDGWVFVGSSTTGLYRSTDHGLNWMSASSGLVGTNLSSVVMAPAGDVFAGGSGVFRSCDQGNNWETVLPNQYTNTIFMTPNGILFASLHYDGVLRSLDNGETWWSSDSTPEHVYAITVTNAGTVLAGSRSVHRSTDDGDTWTESGEGIDLFWVFAMVGTHRGSVVAGGDPGLFRSTDDGLTWSEVTGSPLYTVWGLRTDVIGNVYAYGPGGGIGRSTDDGETWQRINTGLPQYPYIFALAATDEGVLYAAHYNDLYRSTNQGGLWELVDSVSVPLTIKSLAQHPNGHLFAATSGVGVYRSTESVTHASDSPDLEPLTFELYQNYPNPFNPSTRIAYSIPKAGHISLKVFDLLGREVATLMNEIQPAGSQSVTFDGSGLASGIYFYRFQAGDFVTTKKMVLLK